MVDSLSRHLEFGFIGNLRDLGGFATKGGRNVACGKVFRSSEPRQETIGHVMDLQRSTGLTTVIDLRGQEEINQEPVSLYGEAGIRYHNVPFIGGSLNQKPELDLVSGFTCMGEFYLYLLRDPEYRQQIIQALEIIAEPHNHAVLFHCAVGKDRTGILAAFIYSILGVTDSDIVEDYVATSIAMPAFMERLKGNQQMMEMLEKFPVYMWEASPISMELFLAGLQEEYGSLEECLLHSGADESLFPRLRDALLE